MKWGVTEFSVTSWGKQQVDLGWKGIYFSGQKSPQEVWKPAGTKPVRFMGRFTEQWLLNTRCQELPSCLHWILDVSPVDRHCCSNMGPPLTRFSALPVRVGVSDARETGIKFLLLAVKVVCAIWTLEWNSDAEHWERERGRKREGDGERGGGQGIH